MMADSFGVENWHPSTTVLAECGVKPADVTDVFITHAHFDHMGGTDDFPNARFFIQERELSKWVWAMSLDRRFRWFMGATDPGDILRAVDLARQGRLVCVDGDVEDVLPGIDLRAAFDTHTWGSMFVHVRNDGKQPSARQLHPGRRPDLHLHEPDRHRSGRSRSTSRSGLPAAARRTSSWPPIR